MSQRELVTYFNMFVVGTCSFLNTFSTKCETKLANLHSRLETIDSSLTLLETKVANFKYIVYLYSRLSLLRFGYQKLLIVIENYCYKESLYRENRMYLSLKVNFFIFSHGYLKLDSVDELKNIKLEASSEQHQASNQPTTVQNNLVQPVDNNTPSGAPPPPPPPPPPPAMTANPPETQTPVMTVSQDPRYKKYFSMIKVVI